jgi:hypothetical protein
MVLIAARVHGFILSMQRPLRHWLHQVPNDFVIDLKSTAIYQFSEHVVQDLPIVSGVACGIGVLIVVAISLMTLKTYRTWVRAVCLYKHLSYSDSDLP